MALELIFVNVFPCLVESGPKQLLPTKTAHIKGYLAECLSQWKMCGTEVGKMNEIHVLLPVYFPTSEELVEGMNAVDTGTFFLLLTCLFLVYHMKEGFNFPILRCSYVLSICYECSPSRAHHTPSMAMVAGRGQKQDVYMTSRPLVLGSEPTSTVSVVHTRIRTHAHMIARRNTPVFFGIDYVACHQTIRVEARFCENCAVLVWCAHDCN